MAGTEEKPDSRQSYRRLVRVSQGKKIAGVCSGLGDYFNVDPTLIRLLWIALIFAGGTGILIYLIAWIIIPLEEGT